MKKKKLGIIALISLVIVAAIAFGFTMASYKSQDSVQNNFASSNINISANVTNLSGTWYGDKTACEITVNNEAIKKFVNCSAKVLVRVAVIPRWVDEDGNDWLGDMRYIGCTFSENVQRNINGPIEINTAMGNWIPSRPELIHDYESTNAFLGKFSVCEEQYFYYNKTIDNWGSRSSTNIFEKVLVLREDHLTDEDKKSIKDYIPEDLFNYYDKKTILIKLKAEAVVANKEAVENAWGKTTGNPNVDEMINRLCE